MARENADTFTSCDKPHANSPVALVASGKDVRAIWVPCNLVDAGIVADHQANGRDVILHPDANSSVPTTGGEVVAERTPLDIPNRTFMSFVDDETTPCLERPQADGLVGGAGYQQLRGCGWSICVGTFGT